MTIFALQENNPKKSLSRIVGASHQFTDLIQLKKMMYPNYREYKGTGLLYSESSLAKGINLSKLKNICIIEYDLGSFQESSVSIPLTEEILKEATKALDTIFGQ